MKIQLKSDLHFEFSKYKTRIHDPSTPNEIYLNPEADVLVLAGDIDVSLDGDIYSGIEGSIDYIKRKFENIKIPILYVPGNHEYYSKTNTFEETYKKLEEGFIGSNITLLNPGYQIIDDVLFIGATLWTNLSNPIDAGIVRFMGEVRDIIPGFTEEDWHTRHIKDLQFIKDHLSFDQFRGYKKVVITHYLPSPESVPERFKRMSENVAFVNYLEEILYSDDAPEWWMHGHTHDSCFYKKGNTNVICNPFGYFGGVINSKYDPKLIIEV